MLRRRLWIVAAMVLSSFACQGLAQGPELLPDAPVVVEPAPATVVPCPTCPPPKLWEGKLELGLNGTEGNSETFNFRFGTGGKRKTDADIFSIDFTYQKNSTSAIETANKAFLESREEWLMGESPWTLFVHGTAEYDEFKAFDVRLAADAGVGYRFIRNDWTTFTGRAGPGVSYEIGGPDDELVPEAVFGLEFERKLSERQKLLLSGEYIPSLEDFGDYRVNSKAAWEILCDPEWNVSLQLCVADRYDSTPNGAEANDIDYSLLLIWGW